MGIALLVVALLLGWLLGMMFQASVAPQPAVVEPEQMSRIGLAFLALFLLAVVLVAAGAMGAGVR